MAASVRRIASKDAAAGAIFLAVGVALFAWARQYEVGTATHMGPGYYPALLGLVLAALGVGGIAKGLAGKAPAPLPRYRIEALVLVLASVVSFALLLERAGFIVASFVCVFFACFQRLWTSPLEVFLIFCALTAFNVVVFAYALGVPFPLF